MTQHGDSDARLCDAAWKVTPGLCDAAWRHYSPLVMTGLDAVYFERGRC